MTKFIRWGCAVLLTALLAACGAGGGGGENAPKAKTTMLVYLLASDLLHGAKRDLINMLLAKSSDQVNVVLQIGGGATEGDFPNVDMTQTKRYRLVPTQAAAGATMSQGWTLEQLPQEQQPAAVAMNKVETLRDFIHWGAREFPAQKYALALWDHGGGPIHGFGADKSLGKNDPNLKTSDITSALQQAGVHFELIGFDACLMASLEVASALRPYANYLVASEEVTTGWGWTAVVNHMVANPLASGASLGKAIVDSYKIFTEDEVLPGLSFTAYSVTELQHVPALTKALDKAATHLQQSLNTRGLDAWIKIAAARRAAEDFQSDIFQTSNDFVDVLSWVKELGENDMITPALLDEIRAAHKLAVTHFDGGEDRANGLMMYFPLYSTFDQALLAQYAELDYSPIIKGFIRSYASFASSEKMPKVTVGNPVFQGNTVTATVESNIPKIDNFFDSGYAALIHNGIAISLQQVLATGNTLSMDQPRRWPSVNGEIVSLLPDDDDEEGNLFRIPVVRTSEEPSEIGFLYALKDEAGKLQIRWFVSVQQYAGSGAAMLEVSGGDEFTPVGFDLNKNLPTRLKTVLLAPEDDWTVEWSELQGAGYSMHMAVSDLTGQLKNSAIPLNLPEPN